MPGEHVQKLRPLPFRGCGQADIPLLNQAAHFVAQHRQIPEPVLQGRQAFANERPHVLAGDATTLTMRKRRGQLLQ